MPPPPLPTDANRAQLTRWITEWSLNYNFGHDDQLKNVVRKRSFEINDAITILRWKLQEDQVPDAKRALEGFDARYPGRIAAATQAAIAAPDDTTALGQLAGIPWLQGPSVGTVVLMVGDPDRWTVSDVNANRTLVELREHLAHQAGQPNLELHEIAKTLANYLPTDASEGAPGTKPRYEASWKDWPNYMAAIREIQHATWLSLRTIDRAFYQCRGAVA